MEHHPSHPAEAFPRLTEDQVRRLEAYGARETHPDGTLLFDEGDRFYDLFVVLRGGIEIRQHAGEGFTRITVHHPGEFSGETGMLSGRAAVVQGRTVGETELVRIGTEALRRVVVEDAELSDLLLRTFLLRRTSLIEGGVSSVRLVGSRFSKDTFRIRDFLVKNGQPFAWLDLERDDTVADLLERLGIRPEETPIVLYRDHEIFRNPSNEELAAALGFDAVEDEALWDVVVVGAGPAGLAASVYASSEGLSVTTVDAEGIGGQAGTSSKIENYLGFPTGISGRELARRASVQAEKFGTRMATPVRAAGLACRGPFYEVELADGRSLKGRAVVVATGAFYRRPELDDLSTYEGSGIYYGASPMDAELCQNSEIYLVGGGNSAGQGAVFLSGYARTVHLLVRREGLEATMSRYLIRRIEETPNIVLHPSTEVVALEGEAGRLGGLVLRDTRTGDRRRVQASYLFIFIGAVPRTDWLPEAVALDDRGFVRTGPALEPEDLERASWPLDRPPTLYETTLPRVYAVGDVRSDSTKRVASAVGEGSIVVQFIHRALAK